MSSITHLPWVGERYAEGLNGKRTALIGYSHWLGEDWENTPSLTRDVVAKFVEGDRISFFSRITSAFEDAGLCSGRDDLWQRVAFFNFIPSIVGGPELRYAVGTKQQAAAGRQRFLAFLDRHAPQTVIVFTTKGWRAFPDTIESAKGDPLPWLDPVRWPDRYDWGTYENARGQQTKAFALMHPERSIRRELAEALAAIVDA